MNSEMKPAYAWGSVLGEVLAVVLGVWIISRGWSSFGWVLVITGIVGFVASSAHLWRMLRQRSGNATR